jgi:hypothetical protein
MANTLRYTYQILASDSAVVTHSDIDAAKETIDFGSWTLPDSGVAWSLEDSDATIVCTITFADTDDGRTAQDAFHNNVKDTWDSPTPNSPYQAVVYDISNAYTVTSVKDGEVDLNS